jgi:Domain of unknown function (DUF4333)/Domain of unknown function (DUF4190)
MTNVFDPANPPPPPPQVPAGPGYGPPPPLSPPGTNTMAVLALIFAFLVSPLGIVFGAIGRHQTRRSGQHGRGLATAGLVLGIVFTLIGAGVVVLALAASSSTPSVAQSSVESQISDQIQTSGGTRPQSVSCASDLPAKIGATIHCTVNQTPGKSVAVTATVSSVDGNTAHFTVTADIPAAAPPAAPAPAAAPTAPSAAPVNPTAAAPAPATTGIVACKLFNLGVLNGWTITDASSNSACTIVSNIGAAFSMVLTPTAGNTKAALSGAEGACDSGTLQQLQVANGGYACIVNGVASGGAVYAADNTLVAISGVGVNGATPTQVQHTLVILMNSFIAR